MKGQISFVEAIMSAVALLIAFNMIIPASEYQNKWKDAINSLQGEDILVTVDRLGKLYDYSFSTANFNSEFLNRIGSIEDYIKNIETQGAVKSTTFIACDCTSEQITYLQNILSDVKFNRRTVTAEVCPTTLPDVKSCTSLQQYPDLLVIWGYKDLTQSVGVLNNLKTNGVGIIEIADMQQTQVDVAQQTVFGLKWFTSNTFILETNNFLKPRNASAITYQSYKWFYNLPYLLKGVVSESVPTEGGIASCASSNRGEFEYQNVNHRFWICSTSSVYWDTDNNNIADLIVVERNKFSIGIYTFLLNYVELPDKIRISFIPDYLFNDFLVKDENNNKLFPIDNDKDKVLLSMGFWDIIKDQPVGVVILSGAEDAKTVWIADFSRNGLTNTDDDHKQLLASLIFSISNKKQKTNTKIGQLTSYINVNNTDILEIYRVDLTIGSPF